MKPKHWHLYILIAIVTAIAFIFATPSRGANAALEGADLLAQLPTYRSSESVAVAVSSSTGDIAELSCPTTSSRIGRVRKIVIAKPTVAFTLTIVKRSSLNSGGTPTTPACVPFDSTDPAASLADHGYTAKPTAGTAVGTIYTCSLATTDVLTVNFGDDDSRCLTLRAGESVALVTDTASTVAYTIEWIEWPR